jgi:hypothetical protein
MKQNRLNRGWQAVFPDFRRVGVYDTEYAKKYTHHNATDKESHNADDGHDDGEKHHQNELKNNSNNCYEPAKPFVTA